MKIKDLAPILYSDRNYVPLVTIYSYSKRVDFETLTAEEAIEKYGEQEIKRLLTDNDEFGLSSFLVIGIN